jgi:hypothetical protein
MPFDVKRMAYGGFRAVMNWAGSPKKILAEVVDPAPCHSSLQERQGVGHGHPRPETDR